MALWQQGVDPQGPSAPYLELFTPLLAVARPHGARRLSRAGSRAAHVQVLRRALEGCRAAEGSDPGVGLQHQRKVRPLSDREGRLQSIPNGRHLRGGPGVPEVLDGGRLQRESLDRFVWDHPDEPAGEEAPAGQAAGVVEGHSVQKAAAHAHRRLPREVGDRQQVHRIRRWLGARAHCGHRRQAVDPRSARGTPGRSVGASGLAPSAHPLGSVQVAC
mmetsp:Transcript_9366/g.33166  ORF Transcript_9366/g.33166 Transcript_9366/m.33166 type:complete len:217 (+) Transcript_9366:1300-1950(+)